MWCRHCHLISRETKLGPQVWVPFSVPYPSNPRKSLGVSEFYFHTRPHMMLSSPVCGGGNQNLKIRKTKLYRQPWPSGSFLLISPPSLLLLCPTLCNPIDGSPSGSTVPGTLQAGTLEWVAISFSSAWKWSCSVVSNSSWPHGLQPTRLLHPWDFPVSLIT